MATSEQSPTARVLRCLGMIQASPGVTAGELADRLAVSPRAVRRYVAILREAEIPVDSTSGPDGGYRVGRGVRMPPVLFSEAEALGLTMAVLDDVDATGYAEDPLGRAVAKLIETLPGRVGEQAALMWRHAVPAPNAWHGRPDPTLAGLLVRATAMASRARITYRSAAGSWLERTVDPWAVVSRRSWWYLLCWDHGPAELRTYRVDRIQDVTLLEEHFEPPADLEPVGLTEHHLGAGREFATRVVFEAPLSTVRPFAGPVMGRLAPADDERCVLVGTTDNPAMYAGEWLAAIPIPFRVEGGPELRAAVGEVAERLGAAVGP